MSIENRVSEEEFTHHIPYYSGLCNWFVYHRPPIALVVIKVAVLYLLTTTDKFYSQDGLKVPSEESIFALLGADSLTQVKGDSHDCHS